MKKPMILAENVKYEYIRRDDHDEVVAVETALDAVSFRVEAGQFIGILGSNGSGKSTLAKHLNALLTPEEGSLWVDDIDTADKKTVFEIRQNVGMIFQNPDNQIVHDIIEDDVAFGPENLGIDVDEMRKRVDEALSLVGMESKKNDSTHRLSGGQKARVAIAGVLAMKPRLLVFDESTAMLDPIGRIEVLDEVKRLNRDEKITVIWITHEPEELIDADNIFVMDDGHIALMGTPKEVYSQVSKLYELGLAVPEATLIAYMLKNNGMDIPTDVLTVDELAAAIKGGIRA